MDKMGMYICIICVFFACFCYSNLFGEIRTRCRRSGFVLVVTRYHGNSKTDHWMIRRTVLIHAEKTRGRFGSETASFHVSVRSCAFPYLSLLICVYMLHLSFHVTFCYILPV